MPVMCIRIICNFNKITKVRKFTAKILGFLLFRIKIIIFTNIKSICVGKTVRVFGLSNERAVTAKYIACRMTSVKQCSVASTVLLLYTQDRS